MLTRGALAALLRGRLGATDAGRLVFWTAALLELGGNTWGLGLQLASRVQPRPAFVAVFVPAVWRAYLGEGPLLGFYRGEPGLGEVLALFNNSAGPQTAPLPLDAWQDVQTCRTYRKQVPLEGLGWRYLRKRE